MRNIKNNVLLLGILSVLLVSCLGNPGNEYPTDEWNWKNAQISSFSLKSSQSSDSVVGLSSVVFTIDQLNGKIFNPDSMSYGTVLKGKLLCTITFEIAASAVQVMAQATNDTVNWNGSDSIDFSQPVIFVVHAVDGETTKTYEARLNIHQVQPDSMVWTQFSTIAEGRIFEEMKTIEQSSAYCVFARESGTVKLFISSDAKDWNEVTLDKFPDNAILPSITEYDGKLYVAGDDEKLYLSENRTTWEVATENETPAIKCITGTFLGNGRVPDTALCCIANVDGILKFCKYNSIKGWTMGDDVPETFPVSGFDNVSYEIMYYPYLVLASGRDRNGNLTDRAWSTMNGLLWTPLSNKYMTFKPLDGASLVRYGNLLFLIGGFDEEGTAIGPVVTYEKNGEGKDSIVSIVGGTYFSRDNGVTWKDTLFFPVDEYKPRGFSTVMVDNDRFMYLFGGKERTTGNVVNEVWRGRVNRFGFKDD